MGLLSFDVFRVIASRLSYTNEAMLSLTCKSLKKALPQKNTILDCCVYDGALEQVRLAEPWGNCWTNNTYYQLGCSDNLEIADYRCILKTWVFRQFNVCDDYVEEIYNGACCCGQRLMLEWLYANYKPRTYFDGNRNCRGPELAAYGHHYHLLDEFVKYEAKSFSRVFDVAGHTLDLDLVKYCLKKKIKSGSFLEYICKSKKSLSEVKLFLEACKHEGVNFHGLELPHHKTSLELTLMFVPYGVKYINSYGGVVAIKELFTESNVGKVDWNSSRQKRYIFAVIASKYMAKDWQAICCIKAFMKEELSTGHDGAEAAYQEFLDLHHTQKAEMLDFFLT